MGDEADVLAFMALQSTDQPVTDAISYVRLPVIVSEIVKGYSKEMVNLLTETDQIFSFVDGSASPLFRDGTDLTKCASFVPPQEALPVCGNIGIVDLGFWYWGGILNVGPDIPAH
jgi:hypothetical protein